MSWRGLIVLVAVGLVGAACSDTTEGSPATAPPTASTQAPPTTVATTTTASTTAPATTAPPTTVDRIAEIEAIFRDLEFRRLDALYRGDEEAFRALFANEGYLEESLQAFGILEFSSAPSNDQLSITIIEVLEDTDECLAARIKASFGEIFPADDAAELVLVLEPFDVGGLGYSFGGTGWLCNGPHPLDG